jgi:hypothetical protein
VYSNIIYAKRAARNDLVFKANYFYKKITSANEEIKLQVIGHLFINIESKSGSSFNQK